MASPSRPRRSRGRESAVLHTHKQQGWCAATSGRCLRHSLPPAPAPHSRTCSALSARTPPPCAHPRLYGRYSLGRSRLRARTASDSCLCRARLHSLHTAYRTLAGPHPSGCHRDGKRCRRDLVGGLRVSCRNATMVVHGGACARVGRREMRRIAYIARTHRGSRPARLWPCM